LQLIIKLLDFTGGRFCYLHTQTIRSLNIAKDQKLSLSIEDLKTLYLSYIGTNSLVNPEEIGIPIEIAKTLSIKEGEHIHISIPIRAITSENIISKKMRGD